MPICPAVGGIFKMADAGIKSNGSDWRRRVREDVAAAGIRPAAWLFYRTDAVTVRICLNGYYKNEMREISWIEYW